MKGIALQGGGVLTSLSESFHLLRPDFSAAHLGLLGAAAARILDRYSYHKLSCSHLS